MFFDKDNHQYITEYGDLLLEQGKIDDAINQFNMALEIKPEYSEALRLRAKATVLQGHEIDNTENAN